MCRTSSVKRHFETKHEKTFKDQADKAESIKHAVTRYDKQASSLKVFPSVKSHGTKASYHIAHCIAKHEKPFMDGKSIKEALLSCSDALRKQTIKS